MRLKRTAVSSTYEIFWNHTDERRKNGAGKFEHAGTAGRHTAQMPEAEGA
jgi:hypothetical protein